MTAIRPPFRISLRTDYNHGRADRLHPDLLVAVDGADPVRCCGYSWCTGECGLPAAVITVPATLDLPPRERKLYSSMTACGPVVQSWRVEWRGERFRIPDAHAEELLGRWWL